MQEVISISVPNLPTRARVDDRVAESLRYLLNAEAGMAPRERFVPIVETIYDHFVPVTGFKKGREGGIEFALDRSKRSTVNLGGGANVVHALAPFSNHLDVVTRIGARDVNTLKPLYKELPPHVQTHMVVDHDDITAKKTRYTVDGAVVATLNENPRTVTYDVEQKFIEQLRRVRRQAGEGNIVVSDYGRGSLSPAILKEVSFRSDTRPLDSAIVVDPRPESLTWMKYNIPGALLKPNREEAIRLLQFAYPEPGQTEEIARRLESNSARTVKQAAHEVAEKILSRLPQLEGLLITLDKFGALYMPNKKGSPEYFSVPRVTVINPSGAGDIVTASLAILQRKMGLSPAIASALQLASISTEQPNTSTLDRALIQSAQEKLKL